MRQREKERKREYRERVLSERNKESIESIHRKIIDIERKTERIKKEKV